MGHEPSCLVGDVQHAVELMGADALFARRHQVEAQNPFAQRDMAALHDGAVRDCEVAPAIVALMQADPVQLALKPRDALDRSTVGAERTIRPPDSLHVLPGGGFVMKDGVGQVGGHEPFYNNSEWLCQRDNWEFIPWSGRMAVSQYGGLLPYRALRTWYEQIFDWL